MTVKKLRKQLAAAIAMTLVATVALGSSTYAWFAINSKVTATGMSFTTQVSDNLFIANSTHAKATTEAEADFSTSLVQTNSALLEPVSTADGMNFFYADVTNVYGNGAAKLPEWYKYSTTGLENATSDSYANKFSENYQIPKNNKGGTDVTAEGFIDYVYQLKAINGGSADLDLRLTDLSLNYAANDDATSFVNTAFRAAVFVQLDSSKTFDATYGNDYATAMAPDTTENKVFKADSATTANNKAAWLFNSKVGTTNGALFADKVVNAVDGTIEPSYVANATTAKIGVPTGTHYYKVVVRVWLEGQDTNCNNTTFAKLDEGIWNLNTAWKLVTSTTANEGENASVQYLTINETATSGMADLTVDGVGLAAGDAAKTLTIGTVTYTKLSVQLNGQDIYTNNGAVNKNSKIYTIEQDLYPVDVTNLVKLPTE